MATWPTSLPVPQLAGYDLQTADATARTDMEGGAARVRRRSTSRPDEVSLAFVLDEAQMATFRAFWEDSFLSGAGWVYVPVKLGRTPGVTSQECRPKGGTFKATPLSSTHWSVSFPVEVRSESISRPPLDLGDLSAATNTFDLGDLE